MFSTALSNEQKGGWQQRNLPHARCHRNEFFYCADMLDTKVGSGEKANAADVAKTGFDAMIKGDLKVVAGLGNKMLAALSHVAPASTFAEMHRGMSGPGREKRRCQSPSASVRTAHGLNAERKGAPVRRRPPVFPGSRLSRSLPWPANVSQCFLGTIKSSPGRRSA